MSIKPLTSLPSTENISYAYNTTELHSATTATQEMAGKPIAP